MSHYTSKYYNLSFTCTIITTMLLGIIFSTIFSDSFKKTFLVPLDNIKKSYPKYGTNHLEQNSYFMELELQKFLDKSIPIQMTLGKIKKELNPYRQRLNLSFLEKNIVTETPLINLRFRSNIITDIEYENFFKQN